MINEKESKQVKMDSCLLKLLLRNMKTKIKQKTVINQKSDFLLPINQELSY